MRGAGKRAGPCASPRTTSSFSRSSWPSSSRPSSSSSPYSLLVMVEHATGPKWPVVKHHGQRCRWWKPESRRWRRRSRSATPAAASGARWT